MANFVKDGESIRFVGNEHGLDDLQRAVARKEGQAGSSPALSISGETMPERWKRLGYDARDQRLADAWRDAKSDYPGAIPEGGDT